MDVTRCVKRSIAMLCVGLLVFSILSWAQTTVSSDGVGTGAIPDGASACDFNGSERVVEIAMPPLNGIQDIQISFTVTHDWVGDVNATLRAPNGDTHILFASTGSTMLGSCGDSSNLQGTYTFSDALPTNENWWAAALRLDTTQTIPPGNYRTTTPGDFPDSGSNSVILNSFSSSYPQGNWQLVFTDGGKGTIGTVSAATLSVVHESGCDPEPCIATASFNNGSGGIFFDVTAKSELITIERIDFFPLNNDGPFQLLYKNGTYVGFDTNPTPWRTDQPVRQITGVDGTSMKSYRVNNLRIQPGQTRGFLLGVDVSSVAGHGIGYRGATNYVGTYENEHLTLFSDLGTDQGSGDVFSILLSDPSLRIFPRAFAGVIYYRVGEETCYVTVAENGNPITFCF